MKVSKYYYITLGIVCLTIGIFAVSHWNHIAEDYRVANTTTEIKPIIINGTEEWGYLRSTVFYKKNVFIPDAILVSADCEESILEKLDIQKRTLENNDHTPRFYLYELDYPYQLSKKRDTDTVLIEKGDCLLKFLMLKYDGPHK